MGIYFIVAAVGAILLSIAVALKIGALVGLVGLVFALAIVLTVLVHCALSSIYAAVLYKFATSGEGAPGFDTLMLQGAFAAKDTR